MKRVSDKTRHYINNADLTQAILDYQKVYKANIAQNLPPPQASNYVGLCILMLCDKLVTRWNFAQYSYREEMKSDAIEDCVNALKSFNPEKAKSNAFNYLSMVAFRACQRRIITERKQNAIKHKNYQNTYSLAELEGSQNTTNSSDNDYSNRVIEEYETKHLTKPNKPDTLQEITPTKEKKRVQPKKATPHPSAARKPRRTSGVKKQPARSARKVRRPNRSH